MTFLNISRIAQALKDWYLSSLRYQLNEATSELLTQIERSSEEVRGLQIVMALRFGRSGGIGNRADDGELPVPNARKTLQAKWDTKNVFGRMWISDKAIEASRGNAAAFAPMLETTLEDLLNDAKFNLSRQAWGDGTGALATVTAVTSNILTVGTNAIWLFAENMRIDSYQPDGTLRKANMVIDMVDPAAGTITVDAAGGTAQNDILYINGSKDLELTGIKAIAEATTLYGIDRTQNPWLNMTKIPVNGEISEIVIQKAIDEAKKWTGAVTDWLGCSQGVKRAYQNLLSAQKQIVNTIELKGGGKALSFNGIPLVDDLFCPPGMLYAFSLKDWKMYQMADWGWLDRDGNILTRVKDRPVWEATLYKYCDLGCSRPKGQVQLSGIVEH